MLVGLIGYGLVMGLGVQILPRSVVEDLKVVSLLPDPPPPKPDPVLAPKHAEKRKEAAAAPPNLKSKATEIVAPPPPIILRPPPPVAVALVAGLGADHTAGAALVAGPGTGSGGQGNGLGSGTGGDGDGGGGGGTGARLISRPLNFRRLPDTLKNMSGRVEMGFVVGVNGRVTSCHVTGSSGNPALDQATCQMMMRDLRYRPGLNAHGEKEAQEFDGEQIWESVRVREDESARDD